MAVDFPIHCHTPKYTEVWTIDKIQESAFFEFLKNEGVSWDYLNNVLTTHQVAHILFGDVPNPSRLPSRPEEERDLISECLWEDDEVEIRWPKNPRSVDHLWVVLKRPVDNFCDVTFDETQKMVKAANMIITIVGKEFGKETNVVQRNEPSLKILPHHFVMEIIPPRSSNAFDIEDKVDCTNYGFWTGRFPSFVPSPSREDIQKMNSFWRDVLSQSTFEFSKESTPEIYESKETETINQAGANKILGNSIFQLLQEAGFLMTKEETKEEIVGHDAPIKTQSPCIFCLPRVRANESFYESQHCIGLINARPSFPFHVLYIPKRHVQSLQHLRADEITEIYQAIQQHTALLHQEGFTKTFVYIQNGPTVAQKIPHCHVHLVAAGSLLQFLLFQMNYSKEPFLTLEQMNLRLEKLRKQMAASESADEILLQEVDGHAG